MAETPCTQNLWTAVMDDNPSQFKSPDRPVEQVSFDDVQVFLQRLNEQTPSFGLSLPTEAQWEYACRAGTETATYAGDLVIAGERNAPMLDAIAWYGGNSGVDFDLEEGSDSSDWKGKQYPHTTAGTRAVRRKQPNPWGLFDMLGNVYEWCSDRTEFPPEDYGSDPQTDPAGPAVGDERVIRGGSWYELRAELPSGGPLRVRPVVPARHTWVFVLSEVRKLPEGARRAQGSAGRSPESRRSVERTARRPTHRFVTKTHPSQVCFSEWAAGSPERMTIRSEDEVLYGACL